MGSRRGVERAVKMQDVNTGLTTYIHTVGLKRLGLRVRDGVLGDTSRTKVSDLGLGVGLEALRCRPQTHPSFESELVLRSILP